MRKVLSRNDSTKALPVDKTKHNKQMLRTRKRAADLKRWAIEMNIEEAIGIQMEEWGLSVKKIPESQVKGEKRPDFEVKCDSFTYIVEVKSREDDKKEVEEKN